MRGVVLAGGLGTRLSPFTRVINKHLLPVYDRPMVYYPIETLVNAGIDEILVVTGGDNAGGFLRLLGNGRHLGVRRLSYTYQEGAGGIADALKLAEDFADGERICVILGDNIIERGIRRAVARFREQPTGAMVLLSEVDDPHRFGVVRFDDGAIAEIVEKPADPPSRLAVIGVYLYDADVFEIAATLQPSARNELEITDLNNEYLRRGDLTHQKLDGWWTDAGAVDSLHRASCFVAATGANVENDSTVGGAAHGLNGRERIGAGAVKGAAR